MASKSAVMRPIPQGCKRTLLRKGATLGLVFALLGLGFLYGPTGNRALASGANGVGVLTCSNQQNIFLAVSGHSGGGAASGDVIVVTVTRTDQDINEPGEGENVVISVLGAPDSGYGLVPVLIFKVEGLSQTQSFTVPANSVDIFAAYTNCDGDESASVTIGDPALDQFLNPCPSGSCSMLPPSVKAGASYTSDAVAAVGAGCAAAFFTAGFSCAAGLINGLALLGFGALITSFDPPDPNYTVIAQPVIPNLPAIQSGGGLPQNVAELETQVQTYGSRALAYANAFLTSANRVQGAELAGSSFWTTEQKSAAFAYGLKFAVLVDTFAHIMGAFVTTYSAAGLPQITTTIAEVQSFQTNTFANGLPPSLITSLTSGGLTPNQVQQLTAFTYGTDPASLTGTYPQALGNPSFINQLITFSKQFRSAVTITYGGNG